jgi:hypothetical protein
MNPRLVVPLPASQGTMHDAEVEELWKERGRTYTAEL